MKVIIFMYGHMRTYKDTYRSFNENIVNFNKSNDLTISLYIASWAEKNVGQKLLSEAEKKFIRKIYNPENIIFINTQDSDYVNYKKNKLKKNQLITVNVSYALKKCFSFAEDEIDQSICVLITRPDILFHEPLDLKNIINRNARGFQTIKTDNNIFCPYVTSNSSCEINDYSQYICGIDLLSIYSNKAIRCIKEWDINKPGFETLLPEFSLTKIINYFQTNIMQISYEKDKYFEIQRKRIFPFNVIFSRKFQKIMNIILYLLYPVLIFSTKFRTKILFNKHLISIRNFKNLIRFLK